MITNQLRDYVKQQLDLGVTKDDVRARLLARGWVQADVDAILAPTAQNAASIQPITPLQPLSPFQALAQQAQTTPPTQPAGPSQQVSPLKPISTATVMSQVSAQAAMSASPAFAQNPKNSKKIWLVAGLAVAFLLLVGGAWAYYSYYLQAPERILGKMFDKLAEVKSSEYSGEVKVETDFSKYESSSFLLPNSGGASAQLGKMTFKFNGISETQVQDLNNLKMATSFVVVPEGVFGFNGNLGIELRMLGKVIFVRLTDIPNLGLIDLGSLKNQWVRLDFDAMAKQFSTEDKIKEFEAQQKSVVDKFSQLRQAAITSGLFKVVSKLSSETIDNTSTYHYKIALEKEGIKKFFNQLSEIIPEFKRTAAEQTKFEDELNKLATLPEGEIWIGKKDYLPRKIYFESTMQPAGEAPPTKIAVTYFISKFNKPVQVDIPEQSKSIEEFVAGITGGLGAEPNLPASDLNKDSDNDNLSDSLEAYYGTNPNNPDTDSDGYKDGDEVKNGYNPNGPGKAILPPPTSEAIVPNWGFDKLNTNVLIPDETQWSTIYLNEGATGGYKIDSSEMLYIKADQVLTESAVLTIKKGRDNTTMTLKPGQPAAHFSGLLVQIENIKRDSSNILEVAVQTKLE